MICLKKKKKKKNVWTSIFAPCAHQSSIISLRRRFSTHIEMLYCFGSLLTWILSLVDPVLAYFNLFCFRGDFHLHSHFNGKWLNDYSSGPDWVNGDYLRGLGDARTVKRVDILVPFLLFPLSFSLFIPFFLARAWVRCTKSTSSSFLVV